LVRLGLCLALVGPLASADWDPANGQWGKTDPADLRVMTWNVDDGICRNANKSETSNAWHALARIVAAMRPDVLMIQEAGDNEGNGTPGGSDSVSQLTTTLELFFHGGSDPFLGGTVGAYVQKYAPDYDLPYIFVSSVSDGYNRNALLSRFPFADLNGDTVSQRSDIPIVLAELYVQQSGAGGEGAGYRGFMFAELDLPDQAYAGDLVVGNAHLHAYSEYHTARVYTSQRVAYYIDYLFNGAGTGIPDPHGKIMDSPPATTILAAETPVIIGGDWNEDEASNGQKGPAEWMTCAEFVGGTDGTDRDRTDMTYDDARNPYNNNRSTYGSSKLDYLAWQDNIVGLRRGFIFNSGGLPSAWYPPEILGFPSPGTISGIASPHRPVIADFMLPAAPTWPVGDMNCDGTVGFADINAFVLALTNPGGYDDLYPGCPILNGDINGDGTFGFADINPFVMLLTGF